MSDPKRGRSLLDAAGRNILTLKEMTARVPDESFGFHVQQAAEKALKAWLCALGQMYPLRHAALARVEELVRHVRDRLAEVG